MLKERNLTEGAILRHLLALSLPIIASSFMMMAYNMTDIFWVGQLSADDLTAVSAAGYIIWFGFSVSFVAKIGAEVMLSQSIGKERPQRIPYYAASALQIAALLAGVFATVCAIFPRGIIDFVFSFNSAAVSQTAASYLHISSAGFIFLFVNPVFNGIMNGFGDTRSPFYILSAGVLLNMGLDPLFIFGYGIIPAMGSDGAAYASVLSQMSIFFVFIYVFRRSRRAILSKVFSVGPHLRYIASIVKVGAPASAQITLFSVFAMLITRIVTHWGDTPVAVISIGANIEALSWMTAGGISTALSTFAGQNYGAKKMVRLMHGYLYALLLAVVWGTLVTLLLYLFGGNIISFFNDDSRIVSVGWDYMRIVSLSQIFMCIEIATAGVLSGIGRTMPSAVVGIGLNAVRVAAAYMLAFYTSLELSGVWWSISVSSMLKGAVLSLWFVYIYRQMASMYIAPLR